MGNRLPRAPVVAMIHLLPLPGSPGYRGSLQEVMNRAVQEAILLCTQGFDGLLVENFGDVPYLPGHVGPETVASLAVVAREVARAASIPLGINVLRSDALASLAVAVATDAAFIRVNIHSGCRVTDQGVITSQAHRTLRLRQALGAEDVEIWADVDVKHSAPLATRSLAEEAQDTLHRGLADRLIVTGPATGEAASPVSIQAVAMATQAPLLVGSGVTADTLGGILSRELGVIVGSALRQNGRAGAPLDPQRVDTFAEALSRAR